MDTKNKITGQIVRADNGIGIVNLKVVIFDIDAIASRKIRDASNLMAGTTPPDSTDSLPLMNTLGLLFGTANEEDMNLRGVAPAGDRLGSVLTDAYGNFEIEFEDVAFNDVGKEKRPDILLTVIGPDITEVVDGFGIGKTELIRLVHMAIYPSWNAGRQEAYFIKIPENLFEKAGLPVKSKRTTLSAAETLKKDLENQKKEREEIQKVRLEFSKEEIQKEVALKEKSEKVANRILNNASSTSDKPYFISGTISARDREITRSKALAEAQKTGINRLSKIGLPGPDDTTLAKPLLVRIPENILHLRFPDWNTLPNPSYKVSVDTVCGLINLTAGGRKLVRSKTLKNLIDQNRPIATEDSSEVDTDVNNGTGTENEDDTLELTVQQRIQLLIEQQISDVVISQPVEKELPRSTLARLQADLDNAVITPGPADTTSFHDFHTLQIAFENVWTEALSSVHKAWIQLIYGTMVRINKRFDDVVDQVALDELSSLGELFEVGQMLAPLDDYAFNPSEAPSENVIFLIPEAIDIWWSISPEGRESIESLSNKDYNTERRDEDDNMIPTIAPANYVNNYNGGGNRYQELIEERRINMRLHLSLMLTMYPSAGNSVTDETNVGKTRLSRLLNDLSNMLGENYKFEHFEKNSVNYGIITTYRNTMKPCAYQCGNLVKTVPLAPGETRSFEVKQTSKTSRARKEIEKNASTRSFDSTSTSRLDNEIVRRAEEATNFSTNTSGTFNFAIGSITNTTSFQADQKRHSQDTKKSFREAILKSAEELKSEQSLEVSFTEDFDYSSTESGELKNPNNELTVTYLLYELERQYKISEKIHALTPVVMVAQEMPAPDDIKESWLLRYDWILKRALLDRQFLPSIEMLRKDFVSNEVSINLKKANWQTQLRIVEKLQGETSELLEGKRRLHDQLINAEFRSDMASAVDNSGGFLHKIAKAISPIDPTGMAAEASEAYVNQAKSMLEVAETEFANAAEKLANSREALNSAAKEYSNAVESTTQRRTLIDQLRIHVKDNILHYMQAIWSYEQNDQRYFRLYKTKVFFPKNSSTELTVRRATPTDSDGVHIPGVPGPNVVIEGLGVPEWDLAASDFNRPLHEVADLDKPLGFKGNYMLFPLKECNLITDFMMSEFVDGYFGVRDPDALSEFSNEELAEYQKVLKQKADQLRGAGNISEADAKDAEANIVKSIIGQRLDSTHRDVDTISLPTGQLYMEALVGKNTLLEPFKLAHRGYDALSAREDLRRKGLENLRYVARMTSETPDFEDPDVDKNVKIKGGGDVIVNTD